MPGLSFPWHKRNQRVGICRPPDPHRTLPDRTNHTLPHSAGHFTSPDKRQRHRGVSLVPGLLRHYRHRVALLFNLRAKIETVFWVGHNPVTPRNLFPRRLLNAVLRARGDRRHAVKQRRLGLEALAALGVDHTAQAFRWVRVSVGWLHWRFGCFRLLLRVLLHLAFLSARLGVLVSTPELLHFVSREQAQLMELTVFRRRCAFLRRKIRRLGGCGV